MTSFFRWQIYIFFLKYHTTSQFFVYHNSKFDTFSLFPHGEIPVNPPNIFFVFAREIPPISFLSSSYDPPYQSRCKLGAKSVNLRFIIGFSSSLVRRNNERLTEVKKNRCADYAHLFLILSLFPLWGFNPLHTQRSL